MSVWTTAITYIVGLTVMVILFGLVGYLAEAAPKVVARLKCKLNSSRRQGRARSVLMIGMQVTR